MTSEIVRVLLVDDDERFVADLAKFMSDKYELKPAATVEEALKAFRDSSFDVVLLDIDLGRGREGFELLERFHAEDPYLPVIMVTKDSSSASAVAALKKGAVDYLDKTPNTKDLERRISRAIEEQRLSRVNRALRRELDEIWGEMIGDSPQMAELRKEIELATQNRSPVLIVGETGVGKELVAREIHRRFSPGKAFVAINCTAMPEGLFEANLFGKERGAHTDAHETVQGVFELAADGVLFLDEVAEIRPSLQAKLLRVIETREFERLGSTRKIRFTGKLLSSTNRNIEEALEKGRLRKDLYYRLSTFVIEVPPLRERRGDIPLLVNYFLERKARDLKKSVPPIDENTMARLCAYDWPGNVRELDHAIEAYVISGRMPFSTCSRSDAEDLQIPQSLLEMDYHTAKNRVLDCFQRRYIEAILASSGGDIVEAARRMGISRFGLQKIIKELKR